MFARIAVVIGLAPASIAFECDEGVVRIAPEKLPEHIQRKYGYLPKEDDAKLDGLFASRGIDSGMRIKFDGGRFEYVESSAAGNLRSGHFDGRYTTQGHWVLLDNPKMHERIYVVAIMDGRQALLSPLDFMRWKQTGDVTYLFSLMRREK